jgi:two-component system response regulator HydG
MSGEQVDILVVDDDISHCTILQALLRGWGYRVALANNGLQALEQVRSRCLIWCFAISAWRRWTVSKR